MGIRELVVGSAFVAVLVTPGAAFATPEFPGLIQTFVNATEAPPCTICHTALQGGLGTVDKTFGMYMQSRGLTFYNDPALETALMADQAEMHSSNSQKVPDIVALSMNEDPNTLLPYGASDSVSTGPEPPTYGCGAHVAPVGDAAPAAGFGALAALFGVAAIRRGRRFRS